VAAGEDVDEVIRAGDYRRGAVLALELYSAEVFGFLVRMLNDENDAEEVFAQVAEDLWRGIPGFAQRASIRTWLYVLARNAAHRYRRSPWNKVDRRTGSSEFEELVASARSRTDPYLRSDVKDRFRPLREALDADDRTLLVLRIDRDLPWRDVARVFLDDVDADDAAVERETTRLRKRFQLLKVELRKQAIAAGIISDDDDEAAS
jgi:RNA polymerase sigma-70 factor, ECF subfamily